MLLFWMAIVLHVLPSTSSTSEDGQIRSPNAPKPRQRRKRDTTDYRNIKIETPSPKAKHDPMDFDAVIANLTATNPVFIGRERLARMLLEMYIDPTQVEDSIWKQVPVWDDIVTVHGRAPVIYGLDSAKHLEIR
ncbi:hypothetical protein MHU86_11605 [Fragilaria crotonensis]|nr:hypothetical protein MHU86_11605 [Fragilaria crotonensis]